MQRMTSSRRGSIACTALLVLSALVAAPLVFAGAPSHAAFVARADAICAKPASAAKAVPAPTTTKELAATLGREIVIVRQVIKATLALPAPASDKPIVERAMAELGQEVGALREAQIDVSANYQGSALADLAKASAFHASARTLAPSAGFWRRPSRGVTIAGCIATSRPPVRRWRLPPGRASACGGPGDSGRACSWWRA